MTKYSLSPLEKSRELTTAYGNTGATGAATTGGGAAITGTGAGSTGAGTTAAGATTGACPTTTATGNAEMLGLHLGNLDVRLFVCLCV